MVCDSERVQLQHVYKKKQKTTELVPSVVIYLGSNG